MNHDLNRQQAETLAMEARTSAVSGIEVNRVLRNTYLLLSMTLLFSAFTAWLAATLKMPYPGGVRIRAHRLHGRDPRADHQCLHSGILQW